MGAPSRGSVKGLNAMLAVLMAGTFSTSYSQSMMNIALPEVAGEFSITLSEANWMVVGFTIVAATTITLEAALLGRLGLRRIFSFSAIMLLVGSVVGILAPDFVILLIARLVQAVSTGILFPLVTGSIISLVSSERRGIVLAMNSGIIGVGLAVGPLISGLLLTYTDRHVMFVVPAVLGLLLFIGARLFLHDVEDRKTIHIDLLSVALSFVGLAALMYGLGEITHVPLPATIGLVVGAVVIGLFVWRQLRIENPLLNLRIMAKPGYTVGIVLIMLGMMYSASLSLLLPLYFEGAGGYSAFMAGVLLLGPVLFYALLSVLGGRLFDRFGMWPLVPIGFSLVLLGFIGVFFAGEHRMILGVVLLSVVSYAGMSFIVAPDKSTALGQLPKPEVADGSAINSTFVQIAESIGSALFVGVLSAQVAGGSIHTLGKAGAYAAGFSHTMLIAIGFAVVGVVIALFYAHHMRKRG